MHFLEAALLGIVEGLTEFLPVSSTGHLMLTARALRLPDSEFLRTFEITIQSGAILAVLSLYGQVFLVNIKAVKQVFIAFIPTAILGFLLHKLVKEVFLGNPSIVVWSLILGGVFMIIFERYHKENNDTQESISDISYKKAFGIGLCQSLAMIPGVSRSAATILSGMALGLKRRTAVEFSFLLAIPTLLAATGLDLIKSYDNFIPSDWQLLAVGTSVSFFVALLSIKFLLRYIQKHDFTFFGYYRIAIALVYLACVR